MQRKWFKGSWGKVPSHGHNVPKADVTVADEQPLKALFPTFSAPLEPPSSGPGYEVRAM
jgi:hypothetical protein